MKRELSDIATTTLGGAAIISILVTIWQAISAAGVIEAALPAALAIITVPLWVTSREAINERRRIERDKDMKRAVSRLAHPSSQD